MAGIIKMVDYFIIENRIMKDWKIKEMIRNNIFYFQQDSNFNTLSDQNIVLYSILLVFIYFLQSLKI